MLKRKDDIEEIDDDEYNALASQEKEKTESARHNQIVALLKDLKEVFGQESKSDEPLMALMGQNKLALEKIIEKVKDLASPKIPKPEVNVSVDLQQLTAEITALKEQQQRTNELLERSNELKSASWEVDVTERSQYSELAKKLKFNIVLPNKSKFTA